MTKDLTKGPGPGDGESGIVTARSTEREGGTDIAAKFKQHTRNLLDGDSEVHQLRIAIEIVRRELDKLAVRNRGGTECIIEASKKLAECEMWALRSL